MVALFIINGKIQSIGKQNGNEHQNAHYFILNGTLNEDGKLITIKKYNNGESFSELEIK
jgi:hypothetical protein